MVKQCILDVNLSGLHNYPLRNCRPLLSITFSILLFITFYQHQIYNGLLSNRSYSNNSNNSTVHEISFTDIVRRNIEDLMKDYEVIHTQSTWGPIRPFVNIYSYYPTTRSYNLTACYIPKVLSTTLGSIFCYLSNSTGFIAEGMDMRTLYWAHPFCRVNRPTMGSTAQMRDVLPRNITSFVVIRNPIDRFVSAFINKCVDELKQVLFFNLTRQVCFGCNDDIKCVVKQMYEASMNVSRTGIWEGSLTDKGYAMIHFNPLTWNCDMSFRYNDTQYIKYASGGPEKVKMTSDILNLMKNAGVEEYKRESIGNVLLEDKPLTHATKGTSLPRKYKDIIYHSQEILDILTKLYYYDFKIFGFPVPELRKLP